MPAYRSCAISAFTSLLDHRLLALDDLNRHLPGVAQEEQLIPSRGGVDLTDNCCAGYHQCVPGGFHILHGKGEVQV